MATAQPTLDPAKQEAFVHKVLGDTSATMTTILASIGDRLGLFKDLAAKGPATSSELAQRTRTNERYVREWLKASVPLDFTRERFRSCAQKSAFALFEGCHSRILSTIFTKSVLDDSSIQNNDAR